MTGILDEIDEGTTPARDKLITARVRLQKEQPFFSYLTMGLNLIETESVPTAGVDNFGNLYYNPKFIEGLDKEQCKTLVAHEAMHVSFLHMTRLASRKPFVWNIACDMIVNNMLKANGFQFTGLMKNAIVPDANKFKVGGKVIEHLDKKHVEEVYDIIEHLIKEKKIFISKDGSSYTDKDGTQKQLDKHKHGKPKEQENKQEKEAREKAEKEWKKRLAEAYSYSKNQGREPLGAERHIDELLNSKMDWKEILYRFVTNEIPFDFTYMRPSKKSIATGYYMPSIKKDKDNTLELAIAIDVSGSVGQKELNEFMTEVFAIGNSFREVKINLLFWDVKCNDHFLVETANLDDIVNYKIHGGGGTDFRHIYDYIKEKIPENKLLIFFSDGYADYPPKEVYKTLWVLAKESVPENVVPFGEVIKIV